MNIHQNAKLTPQSRADVVRQVLDEGQTPKAVATPFGVCARTVRKWVARYRAEGADGLLDRSSRPHRSPRSIPAAVINRITALRRLRWTGAQIAATVSRVLRRQGLARLLPLPCHIQGGEKCRLDPLASMARLGRKSGVGRAVRFAVGAQGSQNKKPKSAARTAAPAAQSLLPCSLLFTIVRHCPAKNIAPEQVSAHRQPFSVRLTTSAVRRSSRRPPGSFRCG